MTNARLTGVAQIQGAHVVLISCLSPVLNLGLRVTTKNVISPQAAANNPLSLPFHPFSQNSISNRAFREGGSQQ